MVLKEYKKSFGLLFSHKLEMTVVMILSLSFVALFLEILRERQEKKKEEEEAKE